jgi:hypothetical protein
MLWAGSPATHTHTHTHKTKTKTKQKTSALSIIKMVSFQGCKDGSAHAN